MSRAKHHTYCFLVFSLHAFPSDGINIEQQFDVSLNAMDLNGWNTLQKALDGHGAHKPLMFTQGPAIEQCPSSQLRNKGVPPISRGL